MRQRKGKRGRHPIQPILDSGLFTVKELIPISRSSFSRTEAINEAVEKDPIEINTAELEALRLCDLEGFYQNQAGAIMGISRGTVWRLLESGRLKMIRCIMEGRRVVVTYG